MLDDTKNLDDEFNKQIERSKKDKREDRLERLKKAAAIPDKVYSRTTHFKRNPDVVVEVLLRADGICERCNKPAPFMRISDNTPYLEVHHLKPLSDGGKDITENAIALCPNCHRELHFGV
ncbi:MAG: HNH endonuclease signature motif containing protein [Euryarchaeota archaeon]|nr:HNH endonuclease signature motif containing protein [Euryarchaeota archaeon]